jgi:hypothetical protein
MWNEQFKYSCVGCIQPLPFEFAKSAAKSHRRWISLIRTKGHVMTKPWAIVAFFAIIASAARVGADGGYLLFSPKGNVRTTPDLVISSIPMKQVLDEAPQTFTPLAQLVATTLTKAKAVGRTEVDDNATNVQREKLADEKADRVQSLVDDLIDKPVLVNFTIIDIVNRPAPNAPKPLPPNASAQLKAAYAKELQRYEQDREAFDQTKMMVIARLPSTSSIATDPEYRKQVAAINASADSRIKSENELLYKTKSRLIADRVSEQKKQIETDRAKQLKDLRDRFSKNETVQMVYLQGSNDEFTKWKRGQGRSVKGIIQTACLDLYRGRSRMVTGSKGATLQDGSLKVQEDLSRVNPGLELIIRVMPATSSENPDATTQPTNAPIATTNRVDKS